MKKSKNFTKYQMNSARGRYTKKYPTAELNFVVEYKKAGSIYNLHKVEDQFSY